MNAFAEAVPDHHIAQRLLLKVRRTSGVDDDDEVGLAGEVVDGAANFFQAVVLKSGHSSGAIYLPGAEQFLPVSVVRFIGKHGQMWQ